MSSLISSSERAVARVLRRLTVALEQAGVEGAGVDARLLLSEAAGLSRAQLLARPEQELTAQQSDWIEHALARRLTREPVSRILGWREFYGRRFGISPATLDPRPDTETVVQAVLELVSRERWEGRPLRAVDVGTGSGCLLLTLLAELPNATGLGTDISAEALTVACDNARSLGLAHRAEFRREDLLENVPGPFDLLVTNPPYVRSGAVAGLDPEVRDFDPRLALDGGADGLDIYRRVLPRIRSVIPNGWSVMEIGYDQAPAVLKLVRAMVDPGKPVKTEIFHDMAGRPRCVAVRTRN